MAGIYLHIPFCRRKCAYCNFFSSASRKLKDPFLKALETEIRMNTGYLKGARIGTIYFGGGTPSLLSPEEIAHLLSIIRTSFRVEEDAEITLEANPDDLTEEYLQGLKTTGINRLSIGVQSFFNEDLAVLGRTHDSVQVRKVLERMPDTACLPARQGSRISIDLMYGIPGLTDERWRSNLETAVNYGIPHISAYALTVEEKTPLHRMVGKGTFPPVSGEQAARQYSIMVSQLKEAGYEHYEVSNFCLPGSYSKHNTAYWKGVPYLGVGPSAHSFDGAGRRWNISNITEYVNMIDEGRPSYGEEVLTPADRYNEFVMTGLRTMRGCGEEELKKRFGAEVHHHFIRGAAKYLSGGRMVFRAGAYVLTDEGLLFADGIAADLFL